MFGQFPTARTRHPRGATPRAVAAHVVVRKYERAHPADVVGGGLLHSDGYKLVVVIDDDAHQHAALGRRECEVPVGLIYFALCKVAKQLTEVAMEVSVHLGNGRRETLIVVHQRPVEVRLGLGRLWAHLPRLCQAPWPSAVAP